MTTKFLIVLVCAAIGTATGFLVMRGYKRKSEYLENICKVIAELKRNISFRRDSASVILKTMQTDSAQLRKNIDEYIGFAAAKDGELKLSRGFLDNGEYGKVKELFLSLGTSDDATQLNELDMYADAFSRMRDAAAEKSNKYGALAVKLGFLFGVGVGVLFI